MRLCEGEVPQRNSQGGQSRGGDSGASLRAPGPWLTRPREDGRKGRRKFWPREKRACPREESGREKEKERERERGRALKAAV